MGAPDLGRCVESGDFRRRWREVLTFSRSCMKMAFCSKFVRAVTVDTGRLF